MAKKVILQLLNKTPEMRLGGSYAALKANKWFDKFDWVFTYSFFVFSIRLNLKII